MYMASQKGEGGHMPLVPLRWICLGCADVDKYHACDNGIV